MRRVVLSIVKAGFILIFAVLGMVAAKNVNAQTATPTLTPTPTTAVSGSCTTPAQVQNVLLTFPYCTSSGACNFTQANCTWNALSGATNYQVTITNSTTNTQVFNQQVTASTTSQVFSIENNNTYTCTVAAVNSCGTAGATNSYSLLCKVNNLNTSPTIAPTVPPAPPPTGSFENTILISLGVFALFVGGAFLLLL